MLADHATDRGGFAEQLRFRVLGSVSVVDGAARVVDVGGSKLRLILVHLLLNPNRAVSTDALVDAVWGDDPPPTARRSLQSHVARLRAPSVAIPARSSVNPPCLRRTRDSRCTWPTKPATSGRVIRLQIWRIMISARDGDIEVIEPRSKAVTTRYVLGVDVQRFAIDETGRLLVTVASDGSMQLWDARRLVLVDSPMRIVTVSGPGPVRFSEDGHYLVISCRRARCGSTCRPRVGRTGHVRSPPKR